MACKLPRFLASSSIRARAFPTLTQRWGSIRSESF
jgi:hypothetical protein